MTDDLPIPGGPTIPAAELSWSASRASGPGGQHVNKTSSRVTLAWSVAESAVLDEAQRARLLEKLAGRLTQGGVLQVHAEDARSQLRNREIAAARLAELVAAALRRPKARRPTRPSRGVKERRLKSKKARSDVKANRKSPDW
ncbi:MAG: alternative ribosome rescue aminoacyl-tRNA hydrolase ArfB [bacterium]|nr:aminoacyl-tRNA hydrolase [Myxococcales bacterium]MCB9541044.1 aminoacyl-tRNA hydrolase [Myxococcales bacterium]MCB9553866.1 aminoacyl-tRNA hydrolase [Myxococcales bacterium]